MDTAPRMWYDGHQIGDRNFKMSNTRNPKVWVIKEQMLRGDTGPVPMDYSPAANWGDLEFITSHDMPIYSRSTVQKSWNTDIIRFVTEYDQNMDFIVTTGQPMAIFTTGWVLGVVGKIPNFLVWRREEGRYLPLHYDASQVKESVTN